MVPKLLLGIDEAVEATGICRSKLYELLAAGEIESVKVGTRRLVPTDALVAFIARLRSDPPNGESPPKRAPDTFADLHVATSPQRSDYG